MLYVVRYRSVVSVVCCQVQVFCECCVLCRERSVVSVVCCQVRVCCECCVLSVTGLCVELITRSEESYQVRSV